MSSLFARFKDFIGTRGWTYPPLSSRRDPEKLGVTTDDSAAYFAARRDERGWLVEAIKAGFPDRKFSLCSIGSGYGGEEFLLEPATSRLALIEPDPRQHAFLRSRFPDRVEFRQEFFQFCRFEGTFDVVYASALSYWMDRDPLEGINADLLAFLRQCLRPGGLGVFLLYGGSHTGLMLDQTVYLQRLIETARAAGLQVLLYGKYRPKAALLVVSSEPQDTSRFRRHLLSTCVENGRITGGRRAGLGAYAYTAIISLHVMAVSIGKMMGDAVASFRHVARLRKP